MFRHCTMVWAWDLGVGDKFYFSNAEPECRWHCRSFSKVQSRWVMWMDIRESEAKKKSRKHWLLRGQKHELQVQARLTVRGAAGEDNKREMPTPDRKLLLLNCNFRLMRISPDICWTPSYIVSHSILLILWVGGPGVLSSIYQSRTEVEWPAPKGNTGLCLSLWPTMHIQLLYWKPSRTWSPATVLRSRWKILRMQDHGGNGKHLVLVKGGN